MATVVAPETVQVNALPCPDAICEGEAEKEVMAGTLTDEVGIVASRKPPKSVTQTVPTRPIPMTTKPGYSMLRLCANVHWPDTASHAFCHPLKAACASADPQKMFSPAGKYR